MGETKQAKVWLSGKVQGVFFRDFVKQNAQKMGLVGYVKNLNNGKVTFVVRGDERKIDDLVRLCRRGPMLAKVDDIELEWQEIDTEEEYEGFDIRHL